MSRYPDIVCMYIYIYIYAIPNPLQCFCVSRAKTKQDQIDMIPVVMDPARAGGDQFGRQAGNKTRHLKKKLFLYLQTFCGSLQLVNNRRLPLCGSIRGVPAQSVQSSEKRVLKRL